MKNNKRKSFFHFLPFFRYLEKKMLIIIKSHKKSLIVCHLDYCFVCISFFYLNKFKMIFFGPPSRFFPEYKKRDRRTVMTKMMTMMMLRQNFLQNNLLFENRRREARKVRKFEYFFPSRHHLHYNRPNFNFKFLKKKIN